ncbi:hypothetical protein BGP75_24790 [Motiliproteus sp. MSK22-1]|nr:hypothetical protein BGP75_24790 [Motiliproteus sp. MSK22-1]
MDTETDSITASETSVSKGSRSGRLPGDLAMWIFILAELTAFALLFSIYAVNRALYPDIFAEGQAGLDITSGLANTLALLSSSYFVARAVTSVEHGNNRKGFYELLAAIGMGAVYLVIKILEYKHSIELGYDITTNVFYQYYYLLTAFHFLHVILGMIILAFVAIKTRKKAYTPDSIMGLESGACYWHMVDLLWLILFPLVYVLH